MEVEKKEGQPAATSPSESSVPQLEVTKVDSEEKPQKQLQPTPPMTINIKKGNRNVKGIPDGPEGKREWSVGLFECLEDEKTCFLSIFCPLLIYQRNRRRLNYLNKKNKPDPTRDDIFDNTGCCATCCCGCMGLLCNALAVHKNILAVLGPLGMPVFGWYKQRNVRKAIRERYNIEGGCISDCAAVIFCPCCETVQGHRELELEERFLSEHLQEEKSS